MKKQKITASNTVKYNDYTGIVQCVSGDDVTVLFSVPNWPFPHTMVVSKHQVEFVRPASKASMNSAVQYEEALL